MNNKPTYEELEQCVKALEKESADLKQACEVQQNSDKKYRAFFENSMDALFITVPDGRILEANPAACKMFGYTEEELIQLGRCAVVRKTADDILRSGCDPP
jgi:PAS domain-containing protein